MKIAFVTSQMIVGGAETYIARKSDWLIKHGHEAIAISEGGCFVEKLPSSMKHVQLKNISCVPYLLSVKKLKALIKKLVTILHEERVDVIEAYDPYPIIYVFISYHLHKIPFFLNTLTEVTYDHNWLLCKITSIMNKQKAYYTLADGMNTYIEAQCGHSLTPEIIPIPFDVAIESNYTSTSNYILTVARFAPDKMYIKYLMEGFAAFISTHSEYSNLDLYIVGDGPLHSEVEDLADSINEKVHRQAVILKGTLVGEKLLELYKDCLLYVGVSTTLLMAASYSKPAVIGSVYKDLQPFAFGFFADGIDGNNICGYLNMYERRSSYGEILTRFFDSTDTQKEAYARTAYLLIERYYDLNMVMDKWTQIYSRHKCSKIMNGMLVYSHVWWLIVKGMCMVYPAYKKIKCLCMKFSNQHLR